MKNFIALGCALPVPTRSIRDHRQKRTSGAHRVNRVGYQDRNADADKNNEDPVQKHVRLHLWN
ncbi:hypothetical protein [Bradyrhizobium sp. ERR14]|uniref:hypothetical protein n=1 Tax=Bradyrhizobium sp. ERR14 TaxID=2663837 RepID=UPI00161AC693|nr:hypothetical protein [Bradyrhizobium sp. ERR14]MBB4396830.1 hypothetical protein [Bradyrhizobium sp. ERR14]